MFPAEPVGTVAGRAHSSCLGLALSLCLPENRKRQDTAGGGGILQVHPDASCPAKAKLPAAFSWRPLVSIQEGRAAADGAFMASRQAALPIAALLGSRGSCAVMGLPLFWFSLRATVISSGNWAWSMVKHCCEQEGWVRALLPSLITCIRVATRPPVPLWGAAQCWGAPGDVPVQLTALGRAEAKGTRGLGQELSPWGGGEFPRGKLCLADWGLLLCPAPASTRSPSTHPPPHCDRTSTASLPSRHRGHHGPVLGHQHSLHVPAKPGHHRSGREGLWQCRGEHRRVPWGRGGSPNLT